MAVDARSRALFARLRKALPSFPDGRINYHGAKEAMVVSVFIRFKDELLVLKRSRKVATYRGLWNTVAGYYDEPKPLRQKALEELHEETGITTRDIRRVRLGPVVRRRDREIGTLWVSHKVLVELKRKPRIRIDFEHTKYRWVTEDELGSLKAVPGFAKGYASLRRFLGKSRKRNR